MTKVEKGVVAVPAQGPAHPQQLQDWPDDLQHASLHYQLPAGRPSSTSLFVMVFQGGRPFLASGHGRLLPVHYSRPIHI